MQYRSNQTVRQTGSTPIGEMSCRKTNVPSFVETVDADGLVHSRRICNARCLVVGPLVSADYRLSSRRSGSGVSILVFVDRGESRQALPDLHDGVEKFRTGPNVAKVEVKSPINGLAHLNLAGDRDG